MIAFKLAYREIKNNKRYWAFFTANLCIGLMGFTFINLFRTNITNTLDQRAKTILSADIAISGRRSLAANEKKEVDKFLEQKIANSTSTRELYSMGKSSQKVGSKSRLTFIKAIEDNYPLIGEIKLKDGRILDSSVMNVLKSDPSVVISREVEHQLKVAIGDSLWFGDLKFKIIGIIESDSTSSLRGVSLAPKVYIANRFLNETNLIKIGTLAWYSHYYLLSEQEDVSSLKDQLYKRITDPAIRVSTPKNSSEQVGRVVNYLSDYLGLIGIVALLISCVGGSYLFQSYVFDRLKQVGILKSLGVSKREVMSSYLIIITVFGTLSTCMALFLSHTALPYGIGILQEWINFAIKIKIENEVIVIMLLIGIITNLLICYPILERVFSARTIDLLNNKITDKLKFKDYLFYIPAIASLWGLAVWQSNSFIVGSIFLGSMFLIFFVVLLLMPIVLNFISKKLINKDLSWPVSLTLGYALRVVSRNKTSTLLTILCMSMGVSLLSVIGQLDKTLKSELTGGEAKRPSLFLFDIQQEQYESLKKFASENNIPMQEPSPMVRARLVKKNGEVIKRKVKEEGFTTNEEERRRRFNNRGINLSYGSKLNSSEKIVAGTPFSGSYSGEGIPEISLEKRYASRMEVEIGDTLTYEVLGIEMKGKVINLRSVNWTSFLPNFFINFQPGVLEEAPKTYLTSVDALSLERQMEVQDKIVDKFPNISMVNVTNVIEKIMTMFKAMAFAIGIMSLCCISVGMFVLYSILQSQMFKKRSDFALQKIIGMDDKIIFRTLFSEYMLIVLTSLLVGTLIGFLLAIVISQVFLDGLFVVNYEFFVLFNSALVALSSIIIYVAFKNSYHKSVKELLG